MATGDAYLVQMQVIDRVGTLARLARGLARANVNVEGFIADSSGIHLVTHQIVAAKAAIHGLGVQFTTTPVQAVDIPNRPGALAELCEKLADAGVSVIMALGLGTAFGGRIYLQVSQLGVAGPLLAAHVKSAGKASTAKPKRSAAKKSPGKTAKAAKPSNRVRAVGKAKSASKKR